MLVREKQTAPPVLRHGQEINSGVYERMEGAERRDENGRRGEGQTKERKKEVGASWTVGSEEREDGLDVKN